MLKCVCYHAKQTLEFSEINRSKMKNEGFEKNYLPLSAAPMRPALLAHVHVIKRQYKMWIYLRQNETVRVTLLAVTRTEG